jgi:hypothetical protein
MAVNDCAYSRYLGSVREACCLREHRPGKVLPNLYVGTKLTRFVGELIGRRSNEQVDIHDKDKQRESDRTPQTDTESCQ